MRKTTDTTPPSSNAPGRSPEHAAEPPAAGKGMPPKTPRGQAPRVGEPITPQDSAVEASVALPHERDQSTDMTAAAPDPVVKQAAKDVARGISDTSKGAEMDKAYKKLGN